MIRFSLRKVSQFLESQGFLDYLERGLGCSENGSNLIDKLQDAIGRGQNPLSILPSALREPEMITISDLGLGISGSLPKITRPGGQKEADTRCS
ncbi:hypothetical protein L1887_14777 [Cichorium endivia]|nr:hypothetical protein L1887_14777 [Cichorium endivia]